MESFSFNDFPELIPEKVSHIFFDLDHTLWDFEANSSETLSELLERFEPQAGRRIPTEEFMNEYRVINAALWEKYRRHQIHQHDIRTTRFPDTFQKLGMPFEPWMEAFGEAYVELCPQKTHLMPDARETLEILKETHTLHLITNGFTHTQFTKLRATGLGDLFDVVVTSEIAGARKPDSRIFQFALDRSGARAEESAFVGDEYEVDVLGAFNAGIPAIFFNPNRKPNPHGLPQVRYLAELLGIFSKGA